MTDHHLDEHDPLTGRDPYPRPQIDLLPLYDARRELLEEIVSEPRQSAPPRRPAVVGVGIAAALAVIGGTWFAVSGGDDDTVEDPVVAASSTPADSEPTTATDDASAPASPDDSTVPDRASGPDPKDVRRRGVRVGRVISGKECREGLRIRDLRRLSDVDSLNEALSGLRRRPGDRGDHLIYLLEDGSKHRLVISADCQVLRLRDAPRGR